MAMRPISDYLKKLLYQYDCIVVPALGAFLTHSVSANYNETTGQFLPPRRKVAFNEALRLDDGILVNYVMLHEGCSRDEALRSIGQFVTTLKEQARECGSYTIDGLGMFTVNDENSLQFDPELRHNFLGNAYGFQPLLLTKQMVHPAVPVLDRPMAPSISTGAVVRPMPTTALAVPQPTTTEVGEVMTMPQASRRGSVGWRWVAAAALVGTLGFISYLSLVKPDQSFQSSLNPGNLFRVPAFLTVKAASSDVSARLPEVETKAIVDPTVPTTKPVMAPVANPVGTKPVAMPAIVPVTPKPAPVAVLTSATVAPAVPKDPFTVIAGSFVNRRNAIRFQKMLVTAGYDEAYILPGRTKGLIKVAAIGTNNMGEARASLDSLKTLTGINPWVMRGR